MSKPTEQQKREILDAVFTPLAGEPPVRHQRMVSLRSRQSDPEAYDYGFDAGLRGATVVNSHFSLFQNGRTKHWQQGYDDAKREQANEKGQR
jgi:hypothetical protein